jgi:CRP/FNR family transcriptional regulator, polysaccharide utilization system transcription regulator
MISHETNSLELLEGSSLPPFFKFAFELIGDLSFEETLYKKGEVVFRIGNMPHGLFFIKSGKVKTFKYRGDGKEQILTIAGKGRFLGYKDLLAGRRYTSGAIAIEDSLIVYIPNRDFLDLIKSDEVSDYFTSLLCQDLIDVEEKMVSMAHKSVRGRLAESLLNLNVIYKETGIELTREELANLVGTAKETVSRLLSEFKADKLIQIEGRSIEVLNPKGLDRILNFYS